MSIEKCAAVILGAGAGTRMKSSLPKVLNPIAGQPMVCHVIDTLSGLGPEKMVVIIGPDMADLAAAVAPCETAIQAAQMGTADAVSAAREALAGFSQGTVFILYGDSPFISKNSLQAMLDKRKAGLSVVVLGFEPDDPAGYGRLVQAVNGDLKAIVEDRECTPEQRRIGLCNSGVMAVDAAVLFALLARVKNDNAKGEYYLTDIVALARDDSLRAGVVKAGQHELMGVDNKQDLATAEHIWQQARRREALSAGVTLIDPASVFFAYDTQVKSDVVIEPNVVFGPGVIIESGARIRAFSHIEGARVKSGAHVGPYARLRPGAVAGVESRVGNFVEIKNAVLGEGAKANHLSYIGDAEVGAGANIGAGTITCNYDGFIKSKTVIGTDAFIGSNSSLVAPLTIGTGAIIGAGSTVTRNVDDDAIALTRADQKQKSRAAATYRKMRAAKKAKRAKIEE